MIYLVKMFIICSEFSAESKSIYFTSFLKIDLKPLSGPNLSAKTTIYTHYK
jgi:hypothetical protein